MTEPRTFTADQVANHASLLLDSVQDWRPQNIAVKPLTGPVAAAVPTSADAEILRGFIERLVAQVEDLAAEVDRLKRGPFEDDDEPECCCSLNPGECPVHEPEDETPICTNHTPDDPERSRTRCRYCDFPIIRVRYNPVTGEDAHWVRTS